MDFLAIILNMLGIKQGANKEQESHRRFGVTPEIGSIFAQAMNHKRDDGGHAENGRLVTLLGGESDIEDITQSYEEDDQTDDATGEDVVKETIMGRA